MRPRQHQRATRDRHRPRGPSSTVTVSLKVNVRLMSRSSLERPNSVRLLAKHHTTHTFRSLVRVLVLPHPNDGPSFGREHSVSLSVPPNVPRELRLPVRPIDPWCVRVIRAAVPEAPVDEYNDPGARERNIRADQPSARRSDRVVAAIAQARSMQRRAQRELRPRVALPIAFHHGRRGGRGRIRVVVRDDFSTGCDTGFR